MSKLKKKKEGLLKKRREPNLLKVGCTRKRKSKISVNRSQHECFYLNKSKKFRKISTINIEDWKRKDSKGSLPKKRIKGKLALGRFKQTVKFSTNS